MCLSYMCFRCSWTCPFHFCCSSLTRLTSVFTRVTMFCLLRGPGCSSNISRLVTVTDWVSYNKNMTLLNVISEKIRPNFFL